MDSGILLIFGVGKLPSITKLLTPHEEITDNIIEKTDNLT